MDLAGDKGCDEVAAKKLVEGLEDLNQDLNIPRLGALKEITRECFADNVAKMAEDALDSGSPANNRPGIKACVIRPPESILSVKKEAAAMRFRM